MEGSFPGKETTMCVFPLPVEQMQWPVSFQTFFRVFLHFLKKQLT